MFSTIILSKKKKHKWVNCSCYDQNNVQYYGVATYNSLRYMWLHNIYIYIWQLQCVVIVVDITTTIHVVAHNLNLWNIHTFISIHSLTVVEILSLYSPNTIHEKEDYDPNTTPWNHIIDLLVFHIKHPSKLLIT